MNLSLHGDIGLPRPLIALLLDIEARSCVWVQYNRLSHPNLHCKMVTNNDCRGITVVARLPVNALGVHQCLVPIDG